MSESSFDVTKWVDWLLRGVIVIVFLIIVVKIDEIGVVIVLLPLRAVTGKVSLLTTLEACIRVFQS